MYYDMITKYKTPSKSNFWKGEGIYLTTYYCIIVLPLKTQDDQIHIRWDMNEKPPCWDIFCKKSYLIHFQMSWMIFRFSGSFPSVSILSIFSNTRNFCKACLLCKRWWLEYWLFAKVCSGTGFSQGNETSGIWRIPQFLEGEILFIWLRLKLNSAIIKAEIFKVMLMAQTKLGRIYIFLATL